MIWTWTCHVCGYSLTNDNTTTECKSCHARIRCESAGGHSDADGDHMCDNGCGYDFRTRTTDQNKRREGY